MVKKISAVLLALVLCFSVVVMPASAAGFAPDYELATGKNFAYKLEWDKASYNPGDTAYLSLYMRVAPDMEFYTGSFAIGFNSSVITQADNPVTTIKANAVASDAWTAYWKAPSNSTVSWLSSAIVTRIQTANTAEENALYDQYMKYVIARDTSTGTGVNATDNKHGVTSAEINDLGDTPIIKFAFKVSESAAPGTALNAAITSGTLTSTPAQTAQKYYKNPGTNNLTGDVTGFDVSAAVATATVGTTGPAVAKSKAQVKMTPNSATTVEDAFSFRVTSVITDADWDAYFANSADSAATTNAIKAVGFVAYKGTAGFNLDTAKAVAQGTPAAGYDVATTDYIQKANDTSDAFFGCRLDITSAATRSDVTYVAFVQYLDATGNTAYAFYDAEQQALLNTNYDTIVSNYLLAYPFAG